MKRWKKYFVVFVWALAPMPAQAAPLDFTVNMSEAVNVDTTGGTPRIAVNVGGVTRYASYSAGTGTSALTFTYTPQVGDLDLDGVAVSSPVDLNSGTIKDLAGNDAGTLTFAPPNTASVKVDYPSLSLDFINNDYVLSGTHYASLPAFLAAAGGTYTRASTATYFDATGTMQTASSGVPRFDHDPVTLAPKGILIEELRTNLVPHSIGNGASWTDGSIVPTANSGIAPDGTNTATLLTVSAAFHAHRNTITVTPLTTYTFSFWAKRGTMTGLSYSVYNFSALSEIVPPTSYYSQTNSSTWTRISLTFTAPAGCTSVGVYPLRDSGVTGTTYIWGAQLEAGSFPTSYIATVGSTATRPRDSLTLPTGAWYNANQGTIYGDFIWGSAAGTSYPMLMRFDNSGASTNRWNFFFNQNISRIGFDGYTGAVGQGSQHVGGVATSGDIKLAAAQATNNTNVSYSGALGVLDTTWNPPTTVNTLTFVTLTPLNKWLKKFKYYPTRVIDAQLQLLTQ